jgi:hypothetical protein
MFSGPTTITDDPAQTEAVKMRMMARYVGSEAPRMATAGPPKHYYLIVLTPTRVLSWDFSKQRDA